MERIWNNVDSFRTEHLNIEDCITELQKNGIEFETIIKDKNQVFGGNNNDYK